ncbi:MULTISPECIES: ABC transporter permease [unclassified Gilliamella]|uniref:ABC transporter permease n=1 Tax=unclassified Gilliamella TaxID=2685620 RepID=UPI00226AC5F9|nr:MULTISPECIES: ABC transporter permease [unclassified Gilliamella]MCX8601142.1 ABC transporter permease [Gilliamella sp. B3722]MCX8607296.1 ABC transporter permease [Gilliamella sp. B3771]MCX8610515.1 ABC transporter permease [Gilliamella sp. B3891]MCX8612816.1 ABC transporter permease [Gilliamella sp. B3773]MCX8614725.1 ABC transporter permease [Gilliamella sp. B3770]
MFRRMLLSVLVRQKKKLFLIALTVALGVSLATAMLNVMFDVGDKVNQELKAYGANLNIVPKGTALVSEMYQLDNSETEQAVQYIKQDDLVKIKMIFWAYNIVDFAPYLTAQATFHDKPVTVVGTWFNKHLTIPTGDEVDTGMLAMKSWWTIDGNTIKDDNLQGVMVGEAIAKQWNLQIGDKIELTSPYTQNRATLTVNNIFHSGGIEDSQLYVSLPVAQNLANKAGLVERVEVSALTTPENDLARKAAQDPSSLSRTQWDTWYCTAYISSIAYQLEELMPDVKVKAIMQVAESEGSILQKTQLLMLLLTILSLICSALAISNLVTANVIERSTEIGLLKALGATNTSVAMLILTEILIIALLGGIAGYFIGLGFAQIIGHTVFGSFVQPKMIIIPLVLIMVSLITILGSLPALRIMMFLRPTDVLHGR